MEPNIDDMVLELERAGWESKTSVIWRAPNGTLHLGPAGAWRTMKRQPRHRDEERERIIRRAMRLRLEIAQTFIDCAHWNRAVRQAHETPIDCDHDGELRRLADGIDRMLDAELRSGGVGPIKEIR